MMNGPTSMGMATASTGKHLHLYRRGVADSGYLGSGEDNSSSPSTSAFGELARKLIKFIQKLEALSIDTTLPSLPKKLLSWATNLTARAPIIEAICDITVPRSEGTCTRCPFPANYNRGLQGPILGAAQYPLIRRYTYKPKSSQGAAYPHWEDGGCKNTIEFARVTTRDEP